MDKKAVRQENRHHLNKCLDRIARSALPAAIAKTLTLIIKHMGGATDYTTAWVSHSKLAEIQGIKQRAIERHCEAIRESGLLQVEILGLIEARQVLKQEFGYNLKGVYAHRLSFYRINSQHPFWTAKDDTETLAAIRAVLDKHIGTPPKPRRKGGQKAVNIVADDGSNIVADDGSNIVADDGQAFLGELTSTAVSSEPLEPSERRSPTEPEREPASQESRDSSMAAPLSDEDSASNYLVNEIARETFANAEAQVLYDNKNNFSPTSGTWQKTAAQLEAFFHRIAHNYRLPDPSEIAQALNHQEFCGVKRFSWGWLCARIRDETGRPRWNLERFELVLLEIMAASDRAKEDARPRRNHQLEALMEMKKARPDSPEIEELIRLAQVAV